MRSAYTRTLAHAGSRSRSLHALARFTVSFLHAPVVPLVCSRCLVLLPGLLATCFAIANRTSSPRPLTNRPLRLLCSLAAPRSPLLARPLPRLLCSEDGSSESKGGRWMAWTARRLGLSARLLSSRLDGSACWLGLSARASCAHGRRLHGHGRREKSTPQRMSAVRLVRALACGTVGPCHAYLSR